MSSNASPEEIRAAEMEDAARYERTLAEFQAALTQSQVNAYVRGVEAATDRDAQRSYNARSIVLLLVVLAIVCMPIVGILKGLSPESFGAYVAPVTGIAGTIVGYWFGAGSQTQRSTPEGE
jgi:hypothetical protein